MTDYPNKIDVETLDGDIGLQCLKPITLRSLCKHCHLPTGGNSKQMVARLRKWYQSTTQGEGQ